MEAGRELRRKVEHGKEAVVAAVSCKEDLGEDFGADLGGHIQSWLAARGEAGNKVVLGDVGRFAVNWISDFGG